jgi:hypothetical protein
MAKKRKVRKSSRKRPVTLAELKKFKPSRRSPAARVAFLKDFLSSDIAQSIYDPGFARGLALGEVHAEVVKKIMAQEIEKTLCRAPRAGPTVGIPDERKRKGRPQSFTPQQWAAHKDKYPDFPAGHAAHTSRQERANYLAVAVGHEVSTWAVGRQIKKDRDRSR